jgi:hypothetical protein
VRLADLVEMVLDTRPRIVPLGAGLVLPLAVRRWDDQ